MDSASITAHIHLRVLKVLRKVLHSPVPCDLVHLLNAYGSNMVRYVLRCLLINITSWNSKASTNHAIFFIDNEISAFVVCVVFSWILIWLRLQFLRQPVDNKTHIVNEVLKEDLLSEENLKLVFWSFENKIIVLIGNNILWLVIRGWNDLLAWRFFHK